MCPQQHAEFLGKALQSLIRGADEFKRCFCRDQPSDDLLSSPRAPLLFKLLAKSRNKAVNYSMFMLMDYSKWIFTVTYDLCYTDLWRQQCLWGWQPAFVACCAESGCFAALILESRTCVLYLHHATQLSVMECIAGFFETRIAQW